MSLATTAPGPPQNWPVSYSVAGASASSSCSKTVPVYQYFNISPHASITNTNAEDPATVNYTTGGTLTQGPTVTAGTQSWLTKQKSGVPPPPPTVDSHFTVDNYGSVDHSYSYNNTSIEAGDQYCAHVTINPANGYRAPPGYGDVGDQPATADSGCLTVVNEPYTHFFGADVMAGGGFGNSCTTSPGTINAFINDTGTKPKGSGSQFGAQALGVIEGFASANLRGSAPLGASGLSFSNRSDFVSGTAPGSPNLGGRLGLSSFCVPDYYGAKPSSPSTPTSTNNAPVGASGVQYYKPPSGTLHIGSGSIGNGVSETIYVDGNVYINGSGITYAGAGGWSSVTQIPSFSIIAKGNIYIDPSVKQLDGVYVAQPLSSGTKGIINTCSSGAGSYTIAQIYNSCKNQLVINGAFVAQQVFLDRSYSSLRYGQNGEHDLGGFGSHTCGTAGEAVPAGGPISGSDCAAEIFNFSPEVYLSHPASTPVSGPTTGKYDDITSLSPVL